MRLRLACFRLRLWLLRRWRRWRWLRLWLLLLRDGLRWNLDRRKLALFSCRPLRARPLGSPAASVNIVIFPRRKRGDSWRNQYQYLGVLLLNIFIGGKQSQVRDFSQIRQAF